MNLNDFLYNSMSTIYHIYNIYVYIISSISNIPNSFVVGIRWNKLIFQIIDEISSSNENKEFTYNNISYSQKMEKACSGF